MNLTTSQQKALVSLLEEGDSLTISLVKNELLQSGANGLEEYHALLQQAKGSARATLLEVIRQIDSAQTLGTISRSLARLRNFSQLEDLCWQMARAEQPGFEGGPYRRQLDFWAEELRGIIRPEANAQEIVLALSRYLAIQHHLHGNSHDYYHPRNCHLPWVIEFRSGLPLTITLIYILVGQRLGITIEGIAAPGHFLARLDNVIFDPYYNGRILSEGEWDKVCSEVTPQQRPLLSRACSPFQIIHRMLINLRNSYVKRNDGEGRRKIDHYLAVLQR